MLDLSKYANDKDSYISRVEISPDFKKFKVIYASGREEENDFSVHNYQVYLYRMEEQFKQYHNDYKREVGGAFFKEFKSAILWSMVDVAGIVFNCSIDTPIWSKILMTLCFSLGIVSNMTRISRAATEAKYRGMKAAIVDAYLEHKEDFAIDVKLDGGKEEKWYVIDVNDLEQFNSVFELSLAAIPLKVPEFREDMASHGLVKMGGMSISNK